MTGPERAADADRERAVAALREHAVAGRLTLEELADRVETPLRRTRRPTSRSSSVTSRQADAGDERPPPGAPTVHLRARTAFGSLTVRRV